MGALSHFCGERASVEHAQSNLAVGSPTLAGRGVPGAAAGDERPNRIAALRTALRTARAELARIQSHAEDMEWQRNVARAEAERWKLEYRSAMKSHDAVTARRDALVAAIPGAVSAMFLNARTAAWDEGWEAGQDENGLVKQQNPYRGPVDAVPPPARPMARR